ncbi:MAG: hypothetical protein HOM62_02865, partial [Rhodospirillaceae bacterium]|nr:hypothetical protein [Rhodospirillaceae bacterium]
DGYQCYGGAYINAKFMITRPVLDPAYVGKMIIDPLFYLSGAFLLIPRDFYDKVGPISEEYFLYFEEADWFQRARTKYGRDVNAFVLSSIEIDHAIGGSTGNSETRQSKSSLAVFYSARSRMYFSRKWNTVWIAGAFFSNCAIAMHQMVHGRWENALAALRGAVVGAFFQRH